MVRFVCKNLYFLNIIIKKLFCVYFKVLVKFCESFYIIIDINFVVGWREVVWVIIEFNVVIILLGFIIRLYVDVSYIIYWGFCV